jgi:hypothetical protein
MKSNEPVPTPLNAPRPFVVEKDCCIACLAPVYEAPDLMAYDVDCATCYFKRQPVTVDEVEQAIRALMVSCCEAVQYVGDDAEIIRRIAEWKESLRKRSEEAKPWWKFWG